MRSYRSYLIWVRRNSITTLISFTSLRRSSTHKSTILMSNSRITRKHKLSKITISYKTIIIPMSKKTMTKINKPKKVIILKCKRWLKARYKNINIPYELIGNTSNNLWNNRIDNTNNNLIIKKMNCNKWWIANWKISGLK